MSFRWTDTLVEPLATATQGADWHRVEAGRHGGWNLLKVEGESDGLAWYHLPEGSDPTALRALDPLEDSRLALGPAVSRWLRQGLEVRLLAWRPASRAVFEVRGADGRVIRKLYRRDRRYRERWTLLPSEGEWRVPQVRAWDPDLRLLDLEHCPGTSLNARWHGGLGEAEDGERIADLLAWVAGTQVPEGFFAHTVDDEVRLLQDRVVEASAFLAEPTERPGRVCQRVVAALEETRGATPALCHRDFHDKQILLGARGGVLVDLDLAAGGQPALDPGNMLAHVRLRALKGLDLPWQELCGALAERVRRDRGLGAALATWTAATLMRLALIYVRRHRTPGLLEALLSSTEHALARTGEWSDIF